MVKLAAGSSSQTVLPFTGLNDPAGLAVDSAGNLFVTDLQGGKGRVVKLAAGSGIQDVLPFTAAYPGVAVDTAGNLYSTDEINNRVLKLPPG